MGIRAPERLTDAHRLDDFTCRHDSLAAWLKEKALKAQKSGSANCFVVCDEAGDGKAVVGYYAISAGNVTHKVASKPLRRNMSDPIPVALLGRLAVHQDYEGQGIGSGLLRDATLRCIRAAQEGPGMAAMLCHAIDADAKRFYSDRGFLQSPVEELTVMLPLKGFAPKPGDP